MNPYRIPPLLLLAFAPSAPATDGSQANPATGSVTIYRCMDERGRLVALRDSPCLAGERQETLQMQRPQDPPPRPLPATPASPAADADRRPAEIHIVTVQPPQPMYECTSADGTTYTSDSGEGNTRWVPAWTLGHPAGIWPRPPQAPPIVHPPRPPVRPAGGTPGGIAPPPSGPRPPHPRPPMMAFPGGTWVRDACVRLPQEDICRRLSDRRYEILRTYHAAMPSGRAELDREQARIDARMASDCMARR